MKKEVLNWSDISKLKLKSGEPIQQLLGFYYKLENGKDVLYYVFTVRQILGTKYSICYQTDSYGYISDSQIVFNKE